MDNLRERTIKRTASIFVILALSFSVVSDNAFAEEHRILVYLLACGLEADSGAATEDLMEIKRAIPSIEVFVHLGGTDKLWYPGLEAGHGYDLYYSGTEEKVLKDCGLESDAGEAALLHFLKQYGRKGADLILWGHGCSGLDGIGYDGTDTLTLPEIAGALEKSGLHFRLIGFDACNMATLEAAWMLAPYCELIAASPEEEKLSGWSYTNVFSALAQNESDRIMDVLRGNGLQSRTGTLTVIRTEELLSCEEELINCFNRTPSSAMVTNLGMLDCAEKTSAVLDGQMLLFADGDESAAALKSSLKGIGDSYASFRNRK